MSRGLIVSRGLFFLITIMILLACLPVNVFA